MSNLKRIETKEKVRYLLWAKSAGRCQFEGCNLPLYKDNHTQIEMNFAEVAHIIGQGKKGPRSCEELKQDEEYINDISNLMLLCPKDHKLIDENPDIYDQDILRKMKETHEFFIKLATEKIYEKRSNVIIYSGRIGSFQPLINFTDARKAMFPDYFPADSYPLELGMYGNMTSDNEQEFWKQQVKNLELQFKNKVEHILENNNGVNHYSIFAFAPIPLLIKLGSLIPDHYLAQIYQLKREPQSWEWQPDPKEFDFNIDEPKEGFKTVALNLSLSADIENQRIYDTLKSDDISIWKMESVETEFPKNDHLRGKGQLSLFSRYFRKLLNNIKIIHGQNTSLHVFPAIPLAYAVEIGRVRQPKADMPLVIYDQNNKTGGFVPALTID
ncbi:MAG: SAVED domain-containing protein [Pelolinea sp.]|nr:SAVED domain-containing protein [Pelolinea sp.]